MKMLLMLALWLLSATAFSERIDRQRNDFLMAEKLIEQGNDNAFFAVSSGLSDYPLYPYLQYQWLKKHLDRSDKILAFLQDYKDTRYAGLLRKQWLNDLIARQRWHAFIENYQADGNLALECQLHWAHFNLGRNEQALKEALRLWSVDVLQPKECEPLFSSLAMSPLLTKDLIWKRFELALKEDKVSLAGYLRGLLDINRQAMADLWIKVHKSPSTIQDAGFWNGDPPLLVRIFAHGIDRMAKSDLDMAVIVWDLNKQNPAFDSRLVQQLERRLALALAHSRKPGAYDRLNQLISYDKDVREWKVRAALFEQNWQHISDALSGLTLEERKEPIWQYWQARSLLEKGDRVNARAAFANVAEDRSFYGFLAADAVGKPYNFMDKPAVVTVNELDRLAAETDF
ncbi:MAG: transglycosylase SLT domain-containing protein, partial [Gammaproteobacteria bacterium]